MLMSRREAIFFMTVASSNTVAADWADPAADWADPAADDTVEYMALIAGGKIGTAISCGGRASGGCDGAARGGVILATKLSNSVTGVAGACDGAGAGAAASGVSLVFWHT